MKRKLFTVAILCFLLIEIINIPIASAEEQDPNVLVVFSSKSEVVDEHQRLLDLLIGHFTSTITFIHVSEVEEKHFEGITHLFYYGQIKENLPESFANLLSSYNGVTMAMGHNVEQLGEKYSFVRLNEEALYTKVELAEDDEKFIRLIPRSLIRIQSDADMETLARASYGPDTTYPFIIRNGKNYYYASSDFEAPLTILLGEILHDVFQEEHRSIHPAYIRLEDVHPKVDPSKLMAIAEVLKERNIPYMIAVVPVYTNPETNKEYLLADSPKLLRVLKYMQENGGSVVMHGYTHQFRKSETGEGFEFWDVENNMPIYHKADESVSVKTEADFDSLQDYEDYRKGQIDFETTYIDKKLTRGIQELANYGLYPLAFEAPHYTMSQNGYAVASKYFSTYSGQVQLSDENWEVMSTVPYITSPTIFNGMKLLPETLGYVQPEDPKAIEKMMDLANNYSIVRDGVIAGFYHPYLGVEGFIELLNEMENVPGIEWIDLKQMNNSVQASHVVIKSGKGEIVTDINYLKLYTSSFDLFVYRLLSFTQNALYAIVGAGLFAVILFGLYILKVKRNSNKFQYKRRRNIG